MSPKLENITVIIILIVTSLAANGAIQKDNNRVCIVDVENGEPTELDINRTSRMVTARHQVPGLPSPIFTPPNRKGSWMISADRAFIPFKGYFPKTFLDRDRWVQESWSGRVIAATWGWGYGVYALEEGSSKFHAIDVSVIPEKTRFSKPYLINRKNITIVISKGIPYAVGEKSIRPWMTKEELEQVGIRGIFSMHDSETLGATIVLTTDRHLYAITNDNKWRFLHTLDEGDYGGIIELSKPNLVVFRAKKSMFSIHNTLKNNITDIKAEKLYSIDRRKVFHSNLFEQMLRYSRTGLFSFRKRWQRLTKSGFQDIPGGDIGTALATFFPDGRIFELKSLNKIILHGRGGLYLYDGEKISKIPGSDSKEFNELIDKIDLPSIGRALISTKTNTYELTNDNKLKILDMPFKTHGLPHPNFIDWPESSSAIVVTKDGTFILNQRLDAKIIKGSEKIVPGFLSVDKGTVKSIGDRLLIGKSGLVLAVNSKAADYNLCQP